MHVNSFPSLISVAVFWFAVASRVDALCRTPDGSLSTDLPCNPGAANSTCCELGFSCTTNNFCLDKDNVSSREEHEEQVLTAVGWYGRTINQ